MENPTIDAQVAAARKGVDNNLPDAHPVALHAGQVRALLARIDAQAARIDELQKAAKAKPARGEK